MNEVLRYEEVMASQLAHLPLPDENFAWQEMKKLLDEEDDDAVIVPPPVRKGCAGIVLLFVAALVAGWFLFKPMQWFRSSADENKSPVPEQKNTNQPGAEKKETLQNENNRNPFSVNTDTVQEQKDSSLVRQGTASPVIKNPVGESRPSGQPGASVRAKQDRNASPVKNAGTTQPVIQKKQHQPGQVLVKTQAPGKYTKKVSPRPPQSSKESGQFKVKIDQQSAIETTKTKAAGKEQTSAVVPSFPAGPDTTPVLVKNDTVPARVVITKDSAAEKPNLVTVDSIKPADPVKKDTDPVKKKFWFSTGVGVNQQIPLSGQSATPYNYYGRKSSLVDYIPSVYARLHRGQKWFVQGEFRYGAPQHAKEFVYANIIRLDSTGSITLSQSYTVKKTFYHQLPLSFHYRLFPGFTAGTGIVYNKFFGAVSEEAIRGRIPGTLRDTLFSKKNVYSTARTDTSFEKSNLQGLFELQYQWKRFTLGARYSFGLQPYIRFNDPVTGLPREEKNQNLNLFLKVELWNSKKKK